MIAEQQMNGDDFPRTSRGNTTPWMDGVTTLRTMVSAEKFPDLPRDWDASTTMHEMPRKALSRPDCSIPLVLRWSTVAPDRAMSLIDLVSMLSVLICG